MGKNTLNFLRRCWAVILIVSLVAAISIPAAVVIKSIPSPTSNPQLAVVLIKTAQWQGSGVCVSSDGIIMTAAHVLEEAYNIDITFLNGKSYQPTEIFIDKNYDVAFCKIIDEEPFPYLELGDSRKLAVGDKIECIGAPYGLEWWHSYGCLSRKTYNGEISCDIAGNPGNSGGPLLHDNRIVGILTAGYLQADGLIFGVESNYLKLSLQIYKFFDFSEPQSINYIKLDQIWKHI